MPISILRMGSGVCTHSGRAPLVKRHFVWSTSQIRGISNRHFLYRVAGDGFFKKTLRVFDFKRSTTRTSFHRGQRGYKAVPEQMPSLRCVALATLWASVAQGLEPAGGKKPHIGPCTSRSFCLLRLITSDLRFSSCGPVPSTSLLLPPLSAHVCAPLAVFHLVDDWGWANAGWHSNPQNEKEVRTPRMDALVKEGIELDRAYSYQFCSPTRSSLQSGRYVSSSPAPFPLESVCAASRF